MFNGATIIWPYMRRYRSMVFSSFVLAALVGMLWGANLSLIYPVTNVLLEGSLHEFVAEQIEVTQQTISASEAELTQLDAALAEAATPGKTRDLLADRASHLEKIAYSTRTLQWLSWTSSTVLVWVPEDQFNALLLFFGLLLLLTVIKGLFIFLQGMIVGSLVELVIIDIRKACFRKSLQLDYQTLSLEGTPALLSRFTYDLQQINTGVTMLTGKMLREPLKAAACIFLAFLLNWRLTLLATFFVPIMGTVFYYFGKKLKKASSRMMESMSRIYQVLEETYNSIRVVIPYGNARRHRIQFHRENKYYYDKAMKIRLIDSLTNPTVEVLGMGVIIVTMLPCMYLLLRKTTHIWGIPLANTPPDVPSLIMFYSLLAGIIDPVRKLSSVFATLKRSTVAIARIDEFLNRKSLVQDAPQSVELPRHQQQIEFKNIRFAYATKDNTPRPVALDNVSLSIQYGECVLVVGENGSGKSTLVNLLPRYFDAEQGEILIDGQNIRSVPLKSLRSQIGVVTQDTHLFLASIYDNIRYGNPNATIAEIEAAAQRAGVDQFLDQLPEGYHTMMGEKGAGLSGGQRQRIALARAIVRNPSILILDEATSAIDSQSEYHIQQALKQFRNQCTTFIITHAVNRSLLEVATRIVVMHEGKLLAHGQHEQLLTSCEEYQSLFQAQVTQRAA